MCHEFHTHLNGTCPFKVGDKKLLLGHTTV